MTAQETDEERNIDAAAIVIDAHHACFAWVKGLETTGLIRYCFLEFEIEERVHLARLNQMEVNLFADSEGFFIDAETAPRAAESPDAVVPVCNR